MKIIFLVFFFDYFEIEITEECSIVFARLNEEEEENKLNIWAFFLN